MGRLPHAGRVALPLALLAGAAGCGSGGGSGSISVDRPTALWDQPVAITVARVAPRATVVVRASARDRSGSTYVSTTIVRADAGGRAVLAGIAAMKALWSMRPPGAFQWDFAPAGTTAQVTLEALVGGHRVARTTIRRLLVGPGVTSTSLRPARDGLYGELYLPPPGHAPQPGVVIFGGSEGGLSVRRAASLLASHGYPALALAYFDEPGLPKDLLRIPLEYFVRALLHLARQPGVDASRLVVYGISRGSEAALLVAAHYPRLVHGVVALVPSNGVGCGIHAFDGVHALSCLGPAWTLGGKAIPYSAYPSVSTATPIPVERIRGPVFLDCGEADQVWPSCPMAHTILDRLKARGFTDRVLLYDFPTGGHGVGDLVPYGASNSLLLNGLTDNSNQVDRAAAWPELLRFLASLRRNATT